ncbi:hypothetical protein GIS00_25900 [Nakamurella sp. YIM 132087]|uniref:Uncharacterized protein n=1 Tax=Nakamurella alba TaxID=2665158 RepID=A0A7K1FVH7_9ACTN|nr:hypothetical protein [Nakamurella alba]MTD17369.1 hypothetical protein [Nakamurella alba]
MTAHHHPVAGLTTEAGLLLDAVSARLDQARERRQADAPEPTPPCPECGRTGDGPSCTTGCPWCALLAVARGERPEVSDALLDAAVTAVGALRRLLDAAGTPRTGPTTAPAPQDPTTTGLQRIDIE